MGCSGSKPAGVAAEEAAPARIRPMLRQRLQELKKRNHVGVLKGTRTQSKKGLLRHSSVDEEEIKGNDGSMRSARVAPAPIPEEEKEVIYEEKVARENAEEEEKRKDEKEEKVVEVMVEEKKKITEEKKKERHDHDHGHDHDQKQQSKDVQEIKEGENEDDHDEEEEDDEGARISNFDERMIWPGSPSFRVYCVDVSDDDDNDQGKGEEETKKLQKEDDSVIKEDLTTNKSQKKEKKQWRFKTAIRRATPAKYLYDVASRVYSQSGCMGNNHHSRLLQQKSMEESMER